MLVRDVSSMNILGIIPDGRVNAVDAYRIVYPLSALRDKGHFVRIITSELVKDLADQNISFWKSFDLVTFSRAIAFPSNAKAFEGALFLRSFGKAIVVDYDDDYTNTFRKVHNGEIPNLSEFSAITVSVPPLKKIMKPYNRNVAVLPNAVIPEMFTGFKRMIPELTIGLTGSGTHAIDWMPTYAPLIEVLAENPHVRLFITGYVPNELRDHPQVVTMSKLTGVEGDYYVPLEQYGGIMRQIDILLCPVDPLDGFNEKKSNLKSIEGQISVRDFGPAKGGCAVIATGGTLPNYKDAVLHNRTGLLIDNHHDGRQWKEAITSLIQNSDLRAKLSIAGYQHCQRHFTQDARLAERESAYRQFIAEAKRSMGKAQTRVAALVGAGG